MNSCRLTRDAEKDLIDIYLYTVEKFGVVQAEAYEEAFTNTFNLLVENPYIGTDCTNIKPGLRRFVRTSHVIYYRPDGDGLSVLRILGAAQDPYRHLL